MKALAAFVVLALAHEPARAQSPLLSQPAIPQLAPLPAGLAEDSIEVKVNFTGARVVLFADTPSDEDPSTGLAVALIGPGKQMVVVQNTPKGEHRFQFVSAPTVFIGGAESQVAETATPQALTAAGLDAGAAAVPNVADLDDPELPAWRAALVRLKVAQGMYSFDRTSIERVDGNLRRARIQLPANAPPGTYRVRAVMFRKGLPVSQSEETLTLVRGGMDETLFNLSRQHGFIYGLVAVLMGTAVGAVAAWTGRRA